jgi:hypothetical protein
MTRISKSDWATVQAMVAEDQSQLKPRERAFLTLTLGFGLSPRAAAAQIGYRSPSRSAAQIAQRPHVANLILAYRELLRELIEIEAAEK